MLPVKMDDTRDSPAMFLLGVRETPAEPFSTCAFRPIGKAAWTSFVRLRAALADPAQRELAVKRYARLAIGTDRPELAQQLTDVGVARAGPVCRRGAARRCRRDAGKAKPVAGLQAISDFMEANVPEAERSRAGEVLVRILNGVLFELTSMTREQAGLKPLPQDEKTQAFMTQTVLSLSAMRRITRRPWPLS